MPEFQTTAEKIESYWQRALEIQVSSLEELLNANLLLTPSDEIRLDKFNLVTSLGKIIEILNFLGKPELIETINQSGLICIQIGQQTFPARIVINSQGEVALEFVQNGGSRSIGISALSPHQKVSVHQPLANTLSNISQTWARRPQFYEFSQTGVERERSQADLERESRLNVARLIGDQFDSMPADGATECCTHPLFLGEIVFELLEPILRKQGILILDLSKGLDFRILDPKKSDKIIIINYQYDNPFNTIKFTIYDILMENRGRNKIIFLSLHNWTKYYSPHPGQPPELQIPYYEFILHTQSSLRALKKAILQTYEQESAFLINLSQSEFAALVLEILEIIDTDGSLSTYKDRLYTLVTKISKKYGLEEREAILAITSFVDRYIINTDFDSTQPQAIYHPSIKAALETN